MPGIKHRHINTIGIVAGSILLAGFVTAVQIAPASALDPPKVYPARPAPAQPRDPGSLTGPRDIPDIDVTKPIPLDEATTTRELQPIDPPTPVLRRK